MWTEIAAALKSLQQESYVTALYFSRVPKLLLVQEMK